LSLYEKSLFLQKLKTRFKKTRIPKGNQGFPVFRKVATTASTDAFRAKIVPGTLFLFKHPPPTAKGPLLKKDPGGIV